MKTHKMLDSEQLKRILQDIHPPTADFKLVLTQRKYKWRLGTYYPGSHTIYIHGGWGDDTMILHTALHEYAHHIHHTEGRRMEFHEKPHGPKFQLIFKALLLIACQKGYYGQRSRIFDSTRKTMDIPQTHNNPQNPQ